MRWLILLLTVSFTSLSSQNVSVSKQALAIDYLHGERDLSGIWLAYRPHHTLVTEFEFGVGVSLITDTRFAGKDIGSHYQF